MKKTEKRPRLVLDRATVRTLRSEELPRVTAGTGSIDPDRATEANHGCSATLF